MSNDTCLPIFTKQTTYKDKIFLKPRNWLVMSITIFIFLCLYIVFRTTQVTIDELNQSIMIKNSEVDELKVMITQMQATNNKRYKLEFSANNVRPSAGEGKAFGYGYIELYKDSNPRVCWSITIIGLIKYVETLAIHGPLDGTGENAIVSDMFIDLGTEFQSDRYQSCVPTSAMYINKIYKDPSRFYVLASTSSHPTGAVWANFGAQWDM